MNRPQQHAPIYFLGIGGIGMSALARFYHSLGHAVSGYDRTSTPLTQALEKEGIEVHYHEDPELIPADAEMVIYTPAIPKDNREFLFLQSKGTRLWKRAEVLGKISRGYATIACAGTHGKTTTSTLVAHLLYSSAQGCQAFLGGISRNYNSNLLLQAGSPWLVAEADEFDRSFLQLEPTIAIVTSVDADHLDIYGNKNAFREAFELFVRQIKTGGKLLMKSGLNLQKHLLPDVACYTYSLDGKADFSAENLRLEEGLYHFDWKYPGSRYEGLKLGIPGLYNVENAVAAMAAAWFAGVGENEMRTALSAFQGVSRRFDIRYRDSQVVYIDDYAHHPEEINACLRSVRSLFPGKKITGVFQPHLFTRTRDFASEFAQSLSVLDQVILLPVYPAREIPIPGIDSGWLLGLIDHPHKALVEKSDLVDYLGQQALEVLITLGAGDIDTLVDPIVEFLETRKA